MMLIIIICFFSRAISGHYFILANVNETISPNYPSDDIFYTRMVTSTNGKGCAVRFFYYTDGELLNVTKITLNVHARLVTSLDMDNKPIVQLIGNTAQAWTRAVVRYQSITPFQFVFNAHQMDTRSKLAIDDISFDPDSCAMSTAKRAKSSTTISPTPSDSTGNPSHVTSSTPQPSNDKRNGPGNISLFVLFC